MVVKFCRDVFKLYTYLLRIDFIANIVSLFTGWVHIHEVKVKMLLSCWVLIQEGYYQLQLVTKFGVGLEHHSEGNYDIHSFESMYTLCRLRNHPCF